MLITNAIINIIKITIINDSNKTQWWIKKKDIGLECVPGCSNYCQERKKHCERKTTKTTTEN